MGLQKERIEMEPARAMLHDQDLPMHLWIEVARTDVYVQNRTPHKVLENKTPEEFFSGKKPEVSHLKKPEVSHLRIFGCPVYIYQNKREQNQILQERRVYLWDTLKAQRLTEYISYDSRRVNRRDLLLVGIYQNLMSPISSHTCAQCVFNPFMVVEQHMVPL